MYRESTCLSRLRHRVQRRNARQKKLIHKFPSFFRFFCEKNTFETNMYVCSWRTPPLLYCEGNAARQKCIRNQKLGSYSEEWFRPSSVIRTRCALSRALYMNGWMWWLSGCWCRCCCWHKSTLWMLHPLSAVSCRRATSVYAVSLFIWSAILSFSKWTNENASDLWIWMADTGKAALRCTRYTTNELKKNGCCADEK